MDDTWTALLLQYSMAVYHWADGLTKTDLMILLGTFMLGHYVGSKRDVGTKDSGK